MRQSLLITIIGAAHLLGGLLGLAAFLFPSVFGLDQIARRWPDYWVLAGMLLYTASIGSGILLLRNRASARRVASVVEGLQFIAFSTGGAGYLFYSGIQGLLLITPYRIEVSANFISSFGIGSAMKATEPFLTLDLFTPVAWWLLWRGSRNADLPQADPTPIEAAG